MAHAREQMERAEENLRDIYPALGMKATVHCRVALREIEQVWEPPRAY
jgi:hypothetical protein